MADCDDIVGLPGSINRSEACTAVAGLAVSCHGGIWVNVPIPEDNNSVEWVDIPPPEA